MATQKQSESGLSLDRRQLLASVAVISTTAGLAPIAEPAGHAHAAEAVNPATGPALNVPTWNVCAGSEN
jgi:hypothetical protein